jgi:hypothetical protein
MVLTIIPASGRGKPGRVSRCVPRKKLQATYHRPQAEPPVVNNVKFKRLFVLYSLTIAASL